jgi:hypothetical protein
MRIYYIGVQESHKTNCRAVPSWALVSSSWSDGFCRMTRNDRPWVDVEVDQIRDSIEQMHGGTATLAQSVPVRESFEGKTVWEGVVHVFDLTGHPTATRAYAWSSPVEGSTKRRFFAVLHTERINSPLEAVRAAIVAEHRAPTRSKG